jgi:branched-chain amino acid transport system permease protein
MKIFVRKNSALLITCLILIVFFAAASNSMGTQDFYITLLRSLSAGSVIFLVASGFSLIFGLLDVLNLAQGTLYMIGAYIGWTVFVRPDTFIDLLAPVTLLLAGLSLTNLWQHFASLVKIKDATRKIMAWILIAAAILCAVLVLKQYPVAMWDLNNYARSPVTYSFFAGQDTRIPLEHLSFEKISPVIATCGLLFSSGLLGFGIALLNGKTQPGSFKSWRKFLLFAVLLAAAILCTVFNTPLSNWLASIDNTWLFIIAIVVAILSGFGLGATMETTLIRPLYSRPIYQLMLTIGLSSIGLEMVQSIWGRPGFIMPKPSIVNSSGEGCPATSLATWWQNNCATIQFFDGRIRVYDELIIPIIGIIVLVAVWILLKRTRLGMVIRAGVQDRQMVEALGINVRRIFTLVFALGFGLATFGGILAAPSNGLSTGMGDSLLTAALIALAIGGLTSYPGAALGSLLVGIVQQFIIKYGQIGISIPFTDIVFKPSPPLVPASTVLLMVIVLLFLPGGLMGKKD